MKVVEMFQDELWAVALFASASVSGVLLSLALMSGMRKAYRAWDVLVEEFQRADRRRQKIGWLLLGGVYLGLIIVAVLAWITTLILIWRSVGSVWLDSQAGIYGAIFGLFFGLWPKNNTER